MHTRFWLCLFILLSWRQAAADLPAYVEHVLRHSDAALDVRDGLLSAGFDMAAAEYRFSTRIVPLANIGAGSGRDSQGLGVEMRRSTELGTDLSAGLRADRTASDNYVISNSHSARAYVRLSQGLLRRWGRKYNRAGLTRGELQQQRQVLQAERTYQDLILAAVQRYYDVYLAQRLLATRERALTRSRRHLDAAESRQAVGLVSKVDVYRARLAALDAENAAHDQRRAYRRTVESFYDLLGMTAEADRADFSELPVCAGAISTPVDAGAAEQVSAETACADSNAANTGIRRLVPILADDWESGVLNARADWQAHRLEFELAELSLYQAQRNLYPDISLNLSLQRKATGSSFGSLSELEDTDWAVYLELRSDLELFEEKQAVARERLRFNRLQRDSGALERRIQREARETFADLQAEARRQEIAAQRFAQAEQALELAQIRYERGLSDNLDLLDAESALADAELDQLRGQVAYNLTAVRLAHAQGILSVAWLRASLEMN